MATIGFYESAHRLNPVTAIVSACLYFIAASVNKLLAANAAV